ncbi:MAG: exonuclease domain-containing protein [Candidatus Eremiobacteraeota bacterium]|nr:exonuclease domain-containing protein [Candidatus Eremiobacteraeota bacterium]
MKDRKSDGTIALWECPENGRMFDALFQSYRATPFSTNLKRFLMRDLDAEATWRLIENGGYDWRVNERYADAVGAISEHEQQGCRVTMQQPTHFLKNEKSRTVLSEFEQRKIIDELEATGNFRVLRRLALEEPIHSSRETTVAVVLDTETNGLDSTKHKIIELAVRRIRFDVEGQITKIDKGYGWLEDPGEPLSPEIVKLTG